MVAESTPSGATAGVPETQKPSSSVSTGKARVCALNAWSNLTFGSRFSQLLF